jgi:hypothetical protein
MCILLYKLREKGTDMPKNKFGKRFAVLLSLLICTVLIGYAERSPLACKRIILYRFDSSVHQMRNYSQRNSMPLFKACFKTIG